MNRVFRGVPADHRHQAGSPARRPAKHAGPRVGGGRPVSPEGRLHGGGVRGAVQVRRGGGAKEQKQVLWRYRVFQGRCQRGTHSSI